MDEPLIRQAVILVGGKGTRLGAATRDVPKPLLPIDKDHLFLDYLLAMVSRHGYTDIILLAGHLGERVVEAYEGARFGGASVRVLCENEPLGTGGALTIARDVLEERFLLMNGDALFDINLRELELEARHNGCIATLALRHVEDASRYGRVEEADGRIVKLVEKDPDFRGGSKINGGIYVLTRGIFDRIGALPCSIEQDVFPVLAAEGQMGCRTFDGYFIDIGIPESLEAGRRELPGVARRPAAFLDRDGVLNVDSGYTHKPEQLEFIPGAAEAVRHLNDAGFYVFVVTNQAGIARGYYGLDDAHRFHRAMQDALNAQGAHIDAFYMAPYHPEGTVPEFAIDHIDRKPNPGMILRALDEWPVVKDRSFLIGDKESDIQAAEAAGLPGHRFTSGNLAERVASILSID